MHVFFLKKYFFVDSFEPNLIKFQDKNTSIIYRNYKNPIDENLILKIKNFCKKKGIKFYLSNNVKLAIKLDLDGAYLPAFNKNTEHNTYKMKKRFMLMGSAHNLREIREKEKQNVKLIFISPLFYSKKSSSFLGIYRFLKLKKQTLVKTVCLGGINLNNIKKIKLLNVSAIAGINLFNDKKLKYL